MRTHGRRTGRFDPWKLVLLVALLIVAVAATGCGRSSVPNGTSTQARVSAAPPVEGLTPLPPTTPGSVLVPLVSDEAVEPSDAPADVELTVPPGAVTMSEAAPVRLRIPSIGVDTTLMDLGLQTDGTLEVPPGGFPAGWYTGSPTPGELGPAIIAGHVDWAGRPGVFFALRDLASDDEIVITRQDGSTARFRVTRVERFGKEAFPTQAVYGDLDHAGLRLITCGGDFDPQARSYRDNTVVFAELTGS